MQKTFERPIVHLFVGLHKTGTTAIRVMLEIHRETFALHGFHIPRATWTTYNNHLFNGGHNNIPWEICGNHSTLPEFGTVADLVDEIAARPDQQHILITEDLDIAEADDIGRLRQAFAAFDVRVVLFIRNQIDWLQANFAEDQKWFGASTFERWYRQHIGGDHRLDLHGLCARWADAFGRITIRCYEDIRTRVFDAFLECCDVPKHLREVLSERGLPLINFSPGDLPLDLIRRASDFAAATAVKPASFNTMLSPATSAATTELRRFTAKRSRITPEVARGLFPLMRSSNRALAQRFGLALGTAYLDPIVPAPPDDTDEPDVFDLDAVARIIVATTCDVARRMAALMRQTIGEDRQPGDELVARRIERLVQRAYPWRSPATPSALLDELIREASTTAGIRLYMERTGDSCVAYRQVGGNLETIRAIPAPEWAAIVQDILHRAALGPIAGSDLKQGYFAFEHDRVEHSLCAWHTATNLGEIVLVRSPETCRHESVTPRLAAA